MDFDGDGDSDVLSGSWPGDLYFFARNQSGEFDPGAKILNQDGKPINAGFASTVFAVDWDADDDLDLVLGDIAGHVQLVVNQGNRGEHQYGEPERLELTGMITDRGGDSGPIVADWDADGKNDLIVAFGNGSVVWFRNIGTKEDPTFDQASELIPQSKFGFDFSKFEPGMWGARVKVCAVDWNSDGHLDLLLGDRSGKLATSSPEEADEESPDNNREARPEATRHGYVWVFLRTPSPQAAGVTDTQTAPD